MSICCGLGKVVFLIWRGEDVHACERDKELVVLLVVMPEVAAAERARILGLMEPEFGTGSDDDDGDTTRRKTWLVFVCVALCAEVGCVTVKLLSVLGVPIFELGSSGSKGIPEYPAGPQSY
jgi:hypothetical protein